MTTMHALFKAKVECKMTEKGIHASGRRLTQTQSKKSFNGDHGIYGLALLGLIASIVCAFFLNIPNPTRSAGTLAVGARSI